MAKKKGRRSKKSKAREIGDANLKPFEKGNKAAQKELNWKHIEYLASIGCTQEEIANMFEVHPDTLTNRCKKEYGMLFVELLKKNRDGLFKMSLRRAQFKAAVGEKKKVTKTYEENGEKVTEEKEEYILNPSVHMLKWMGMQHLGQSDKVENSSLEKLLKEGNIKVDWSDAP